MMPRREASGVTTSRRATAMKRVLLQFVSQIDSGRTARPLIAAASSEQIAATDLSPRRATSCGA